MVLAFPFFDRQIPLGSTLRYTTELETNKSNTKQRFSIFAFSIVTQ